MQMQLVAFGAKCGSPAPPDADGPAASNPSSLNSDASASIPIPLDADVRKWRRLENRDSSAGVIALLPSHELIQVQHRPRQPEPGRLRVARLRAQAVVQPPEHGGLVRRGVAPEAAAGQECEAFVEIETGRGGGEA